MEPRPPGYENLSEPVYQEIVETSKLLKKKLKQCVKNDLISMVIQMVNMHAQQKQINQVLLARLKEGGIDVSSDLDLNAN